MATEHVISTGVDTGQGHAKAAPNGKGPAHFLPNIAINLERKSQISIKYIRSRDAEQEHWTANMMQVQSRTSKASHLILDRLQEDLGLESMLCRRSLGLISGIPHGPLSTAKVAQEQANKPTMSWGWG